MISNASKPKPHRKRTVGQIGLPQTSDRINLISNDDYEQIWLVTLLGQQLPVAQLNYLQPVSWIDDQLSEFPPEFAWKECDMCEDYVCTYCREHVYDCDCAPIDEWTNSNPYLSHHPAFEVEVVKVSWPDSGVDENVIKSVNEMMRVLHKLMPPVLIFEHSQKCFELSDLDINRSAWLAGYFRVKIECDIDAIVWRRVSTKEELVSEIQHLIQEEGRGCLKQTKR